MRKNLNMKKNLIILALLCFVMMSFYFLVVKPTTKERQKRERQNTARYNLRLLGDAIRGYSEKNNGYLPVAERWCDLLMEYDKALSRDTFKHPRIAGIVIAFNENLDGMRLSDVDKSTVLLFEAEGGWNLAGEEKLIKKENPDRKPLDAVLLANGKIVTYFVKEDGYKNGALNTMQPLRWLP